MGSFSGFRAKSIGISRWGQLRADVTTWGSGRAFRERARLSKGIPCSRRTARSQPASEAFLVCAYRPCAEVASPRISQRNHADLSRTKRKTIPPVRVNNGPCKENIILGDDVDVLKFPIPLIHGGDGGRYIGTWHTVITKDPDSSWVNWGMYRLMVHDRNTLGCLFPLQQHIGQMYQKYEAMAGPCPWRLQSAGSR